MQNRYRFGTTLLAIGALLLTGLLTQPSANAQAVSSLPVALYQGTCTGSIEHVTDLEPIVPAASVTGATFAGSEEAIDVASSVTTVEVGFDELMANAPLSIIVASGTGTDASEIACGVIGGFVSNDMVVFGIDDANNTGISGVGSVANLGDTVSITIFLGEFPVAAAGATTASTTGAACDETAAVLVTTAHGPAIAGDADGDNITDTDEATFGTDPDNADSDADGQMDGIETGFTSTNPLDADSFGIDSDVDGLPDELEASLGTDPAVADTDADGIPDGWEFFLGNDPLVAGTNVNLDSDQDGLPDDIELQLGTDLASSDTDRDGTADGAEIQAGSNPLLAGC